MTARARRRPSGSQVVIVSLGVAVLIFMAAPLVVLMIQSFSSTTDFTVRPDRLTLHWYGQFFADPELRSAMVNSLAISGIVTAVCLIMGVTAALAFSHASFRGKRSLELLVFLPGIMPWLLLGIAMNTVLAFFLPGTTSIVPPIIGQTTLLMPFAFFITLMGVRGVDPTLELAAVDLGASLWTTMRRVTVPLVTPWIIGAGLTVFSLSFNELIVTSLLLNRGATLPLYVYSTLRIGLTPEINAVAGVLVFAAVILGVAAVWAMSTRERRRRAARRPRNSGDDLSLLPALESALHTNPAGGGK